MTNNYYDENRQKEIMESLSGEKLLKESKLYKGEELAAYQSFADALLRNILLPENDMITLNINNLAAYLQRKAESFGLAEDHNVNYTIGQVERLSKKIYGMKKGIEGETLAKRAMFGINAPNKILTNLEFTMDDLPFETDVIVINSKGICVIEVKNIHHDLVIDENGTLVATDGSKRTYCNIRMQLNNTVSVIRRVLEQSFPDNPKLLTLAGHIHAVLFTAGSTIIDSHHEIIVADRNNIVRILNNLPGEDTLNREEINMVAKAIKNAAQKNQYPLNYDYARVAKSFAIAEAKLEYAANHNSISQTWKSLNSENEEDYTDDFDEEFVENEKLSTYVANKKSCKGQIAAAVIGTLALGVGLLLCER